MFKTIAAASVFCFFISFLMSSCAVNRTIPNKKLDKSIVLADFDPQKHVILMEEMPFDRKGKLNRKMNDLLVKYYPGKFEIVERIALTNAKYSDTSIYKYAVVNALRGVNRTTTTTITNANGTHSVSPSATTTYITYSFLDRTNNKTYGQSYPSAWLKTSVEAFANTVKKAKGL